MIPRRIDLLAIGDPCADIVIHAARLPAWDDKCVGRMAGVYSGGTEANVACAASRLGLVTGLFGEVGSDGHADFLVDELNLFRVDTSHVQRRPASASATTTIFISPTGERAIVWVPMTRRQRSGLEAALQACRLAYTMPRDEADLAALYRSAHSAGARLAIDVEREGAARPGALHSFIQHADIAFMNESGFTTAMGAAPDIDGLRALRAIGGARTLVVTMGARGAIGIDERGVGVQAAFPAKVVDTTGAGDTFNAAFLQAHLSGAALQQALAIGCAAASSAVAAIGARTGMPRPGDVAAVLKAARSQDPCP